MDKNFGNCIICETGEPAFQITPEDPLAIVYVSCNDPNCLIKSMRLAYQICPQELALIVCPFGEEYQNLEKLRTDRKNDIRGKI